MTRSARPAAAAVANPHGWPEELLDLFAGAVTAEYASLTRAGAPVTYPLTPYVGAGGRTLDVSTGLTYPAKAERARRDPRVALLFADAAGRVALVQGIATVRDSDLQANTDRYVRLSMAKLPAAYAGKPRLVLRSLAWYFARIWIEVTPTRMLWWPAGVAGVPGGTPRQWTAPPGTVAPPSDPAPPGRALPPGRSHRIDRHDGTAGATADTALRSRDLTFVGDDGFPVVLPIRDLQPAPDGFRLTVPRVPGARPHGPACLTLHGHDEPFTTQRNRVFVGRLDEPAPDGTVRLRIERQLGDRSLPTGRLAAALDLTRNGRVLRPHLLAECARRGRPVPRVNLP